mgnify:CR=1 FL=1
MAKGRIKKKIQNTVDKLGNKLKKDADDIANIEVPKEEVVVETKTTETTTREWKIKV